MRILSSVCFLFLPWPSVALLTYQRLRVGSKHRNFLKTTSCWTMRLNPSSFEGTDLTIAEYPKPVLRQTTAAITAFDNDLQQTAKEMIHVMYQAKGVGLAAPQVNLGLQLFVYNPTGDPLNKNFERVVCNPKIKEYSSETDIEHEGCLSCRSEECAGCVCRACSITVEYHNELGQKIMRRLKGFEARVFQHEYDHLQGILCFDRFSPQDKEKSQPMLDTLVQNYGQQDAILDADPLLLQAIQPPPLTAGRMPTKLQIQKEQDEVTKKKKEVKAKAGFGSGGFGGGGQNIKSKRKKKKK